MIFTVIAAQSHHSQGDAYREITYTTYKVLGTVDAPDAKSAIPAMEMKLRGNRIPYSGDVIVVPGHVTEVVEGSIYSKG